MLQKTIVFQNTNASDYHCFQSSILQELQSALPLMLWILLVFIFLSLFLLSHFRSRESFLFLSSIPSTTSQSHILLRETVAILSYDSSHREEQTARQRNQRMTLHSFLKERIVCEMKSKQDSTVCPYSPMKSPSGGMGCVYPPV